MSLQSKSKQISDPMAPCVVNILFLFYFEKIKKKEEGEEDEKINLKCFDWKNYF